MNPFILGGLWIALGSVPWPIIWFWRGWLTKRD